MCILAYVPHFKTIERFSITFQTANGKREFVNRPLFTPAKKLLVSHYFLPYEADKLISYQLISSLRNSQLNSAIFHNRYSRSL